MNLEAKLEVVVLPVSDVDRSKHFYRRLGWRLDADFSNGNDWRVIQLTPPGSPCSIVFGKGVTTATPGSVQGLFLIVSDIIAARAELIGHDVDVTEVFHFAGGLHVTGTDGLIPGPDPQGNSYASWASFEDPDGNGWLLQEVKTRLPGRGMKLDGSTLGELLREAEAHHDAYEKSAPKHHWSSFYATFVLAREQGKTAEEAAQAGAREVERARMTAELSAG